MRRTSRESFSPSIGSLDAQDGHQDATQETVMIRPLSMPIAPAKVKSEHLITEVSVHTRESSSEMS